jgi:hypothetical protein
MGKTSKKNNLGNLGFIDIEFRNELDEPQFKVKRRSLRKGIADFEEFLDKKYGIKGFTLDDQGFSLRRKNK